jgi:type II secretory pathway pseudopilin PulG
MGLMDKVRAQSTQLAQMAQETAREGKVKLDQAQAKRRADAMFRDLGATVYAERTGRGTPDSKGKIDRLVDALSRQEASQGLGDPDGSTPPGSTPPGSTSPDGTSPGSTSPDGTSPGGTPSGSTSPGSTSPGDSPPEGTPPAG